MVIWNRCILCNVLYNTHNLLFLNDFLTNHKILPMYKIFFHNYLHYQKFQNVFYDIYLLEYPVICGHCILCNVFYNNPNLLFQDDFLTNHKILSNCNRFYHKMLYYQKFQNPFLYNVFLELMVILDRCILCNVYHNKFHLPLLDDFLTIHKIFHKNIYP